MCFVLALGLLLTGCDRTSLEDETPPDATLGTFEVTVRQVGGGGFEDLEGRAEFATTSSGGVLLRLTSPLPGATSTSPADSTSTLDLAFPATPGEITFADNPDAAFCYQSLVFEDGPYRAENGTLELDLLTAREASGTIRARGFRDLPISPTTNVRLRVEVEGAFRAVPGAPVTTPGSVGRCVPR